MADAKDPLLALLDEIAGADIAALETAQPAAAASVVATPTEPEVAAEPETLAQDEAAADPAPVADTTPPAQPSLEADVIAKVAAAAYAQAKIDFAPVPVKETPTKQEVVAPKPLFSAEELDLTPEEAEALKASPILDKIIKRHLNNYDERRTQSLATSLTDLQVHQQTLVEAQRAQEAQQVLATVKSNLAGDFEAKTTHPKWGEYLNAQAALHPTGVTNGALLQNAVNANDANYITAIFKNFAITDTPVKPQKPQAVVAPRASGASVPSTQTPVTAEVLDRAYTAAIEEYQQDKTPTKYQKMLEARNKFHSI